ncbi:MAG: YdeI/OmpD-associated family protein [Bacteroidetes bacterium]|nr:YdeI/OmpD-associated family protein [Bacteroidota bacterium]
MFYIEVSKSVINQLGVGINIRLLCTLNKQLTFQCGLVALGNGSAYISINKKRMKVLKVKKGDEVNVDLVIDTSEYGMDMPEELEELLIQDIEGKRRFDLLTPGKKRYIIHYISVVKSKQIRLDKALLLIGNLKLTKEGKESFREILVK